MRAVRAGFNATTISQIAPHSLAAKTEWYFGKRNKILLELPLPTGIVRWRLK